MKRISKDDQLAMEELIGLWKLPLFRFFLRSLNHHQDSEDLTQRVFIRVYRSSARYVPKAKFSTWIFTVARNLLIDEIKKRQRRPQIVSDEHIENRNSMNSGNLQEWNEILLRRLDTIPENQKTALLLRVQRELSYKEIAEVMKTTESSVKTWIHRARLDLKSSLSSTDKTS
ncbi:MAG: RNA polymerase sigma factor [Opitutae bacterium]|nr:RNA polymerase sigma factor [Opitutae bacterium]